MIWNEGNSLDPAIKREIRSAVNKHRIFWMLLWLSLFGGFVYWAVIVAVQEHSYWFLASVMVYIVAALIVMICGGKKIERLDTGCFKWAEAEIREVCYLNGRYSHSKVITDIGSFTTGQWIFRFRKNMRVIVIKYSMTDDIRNLKENLTFLYDPVAYRISFWDGTSR